MRFLYRADQECSRLRSDVSGCARGAEWSNAGALDLGPFRGATELKERMRGPSLLVALGGGDSPDGRG